MLFDSSNFLIFLGAFLPAYWLVRSSLRARNGLIVAASFLFYGWWDWRFLGLLAGTSVFDFAMARLLQNSNHPGQRRFWLGLSLTINLGVLGIFKYSDFFLTSLTHALRQAGLTISLPALEFVLPVGISFYTFQTMSYVVDVYRRQVTATDSLVDYLAYVSFFPQLVAGPIERAGRLLPQMETPRVITTALVTEGVWLMTQGMFKKVVLAGNLAPLVDLVYEGTVFSGPCVGLGTLAFGLQIYADFSGYSDIARGVARILGFDLMVNFRVPYAATSLREFWRRWHISLSTWLRDYLYVSLGGNRRGASRTCFNLGVTMVLGGLWHGASWHFVLWGAWHGLGLILVRLGQFRLGDAHPSARLPLRKVLAWLLTMAFVFYGWLLFRARSWEAIVAMTGALTDGQWPRWTAAYVTNLVAFGLPLAGLDLLQIAAERRSLAQPVGGWFQAFLLSAMGAGIVLYWQAEPAPFLYFQF